MLNLYYIKLKFMFQLGGFSALLYFFFYFFIFFVLGNSSVDFVISVCFFFLFYILYLNFREYIYNYLLLLSKDLWFKYNFLFLLLNMLHKLILNFSNVYLNFIIYKVYILYSIETSFDNMIFNIVKKLYNKFLINNILKQLNFKIKYINSFIFFSREFAYICKRKNYIKYIKYINIMKFCSLIK